MKWLTVISISICYFSFIAEIYHSNDERKKIPWVAWKIGSKLWDTTLNDVWEILLVLCQGLWCKTRNLWSWFKELHDQLLNYCACFFSCITIGVPCSMLKKQRTIILLCIKADRIIHIHSQAIMHHPSKRSRGATTSQKRLRVNLYAFNNLNFLKWYEHTIYTYHRITLKLPLPLSYSLLWNSWLLIFAYLKGVPIYNQT